MSDSPEYESWSKMIARCENPKDKRFHRYGGRGIRVCQRWRDSFIDFLSDVGRRPDPSYSLDRIDNDGDYEPGNVRWADRNSQSRNRSTNVLSSLERILLRQMWVRTKRYSKARAAIAMAFGVTYFHAHWVGTSQGKGSDLDDLLAKRDALLEAAARIEERSER